jgi:hypothetical protein
MKCSLCERNPCRRGRPEREQLNADGLTLLKAQRDLYVLRGRRVLLECLLCAGEGTADDVRDNLELPPGLALTLFGAVPGELARAGIIRRVGFTPTCRPTAHGRPVTVWALADRAAADKWLREHPDVSVSVYPTNNADAAVTAAPLLKEVHANGT